MSDETPLCPATLRWAAIQLLNTRNGGGLTADELAEKVNGIYAKEWIRLESDIEDEKRRCFFFGCWPGSGGGHHWHDRYGSYHEARKEQPFQYPDGTYQPDNGEVQGPAALRHKDGWTILAWWDRFEDKRPACCSALAFEGTRTFGYMVELLRVWFPKVHDRRKLTQWHGKTRMEREN